MKPLLKLETTFPQWVTGQRVSVAAWRLRNADYGAGSTARFLTYLKQEIDKRPYNHLPLGALALLEGLREEDVSFVGISHGELKSACERRILSLRRERKNPRRPGLVRAARIVADSLVSTGSHARAIGTLGGANLDRSWRNCATNRRLRKALDRALAIFQSSRQTVDKIQALADLRVEATRESVKLAHWEYVEFYTLNSFLAWPLLVMPGAENDVSSGIGYGLPFLVDVTYDYRSRVVLKNSELCNLEPFTKSFEDCLDAAKKLWASQKGNYPKEWKKKVLEASLMVDSSLVTEVLRPFGEGVIYGPSLESYLTIAILGRFVGVANLPPIAATGKLGEPVKRGEVSLSGDVDLSEIDPFDAATVEPGRMEAIRQAMARLVGRAPAKRAFELDRRVEHVGGVVQKLRWAQATGQFDRVILPPGADGEARQDKNLQTYIDSHEATGEIIVCDSLSRVADAALAGQWRRHRFLRAPDVAWVYHKVQPPEGRHPRIEPVLTFLESNTRTVADVPKHIGLGDLVLTLRHLNMSWRDGQRPLLPMRSLLFFRMVADEPRGRLLSTLWKAIGAPDATFRDLVNAASVEEAVAIVARALNQPGPTEKFPAHSPPDVLVFIQPPATEQDAGPMAVRWSDEAHIFEELFGESLSRKLKSFSKRARAGEASWWDVLRSTRILKIADSSLDAFFPPPSPSADTQAVTGLQELATFRQGFTQNMAGLVLDDAHLRGSSVRDWLKRRENEKVIFSVFNRYFMTDAAKKHYVITDPVRRAQAHGRAGSACAPYINPRRLPGLIEFEARLPEMVHEAEYHFENAHRRPRGIANRAAWSRYARGNVLKQFPQARLSCSYEMKSWDIPRFAVAAHWFPLATDGMRIAVNLVEDRGDRKLRPFELTVTLGLIDRHLDELARGGLAGDPDEIKEITDLAKKRLGMNAYDAFKVLSGRQDTLEEAVRVAARLATIVMRPGGLNLLWPWQLKRLNKFVSNALRTKGVPGRRVPPQWYIRFGDSMHQKYPAKSEEIYAIGRGAWMPNVPPARPLWVHSLGLAGSGSETERTILEALAQFHRAQSDEYFQFLRQVMRSKSDSKLWEAGREKLRQIG